MNKAKLMHSKQHTIVYMKGELPCEDLQQTKLCKCNQNFQ